MKCNKCKTQNENGANFCESCGSPLKKAKANKPNDPNKRRDSNPPISKFSIINYFMAHKHIRLILSASLTLLIVGIVINSGKKPNITYEPTIQIPNSTPNSNLIVDSKVLGIASKFACGCGKCGEKSLDICECDYAIAERNFIKEAIDQNKNESEIISAVMSKYGGLKPQLSNTLEPTKLIITNPPLKMVAGLATYSDREQIYSEFKCPCGQCGVDELKDCTCNHKNGAQDVKKFIDQKISENSFTMAQIIGLVDNTYGGKK